MKSSMFMVAMLFILSMTACTANENDPMEQAETLSSLTSTYGARSLAATDNICKKLHFASLEYQSLEGIFEAIGLEPCKVCTYCWNGKG